MRAKTLGQSMAMVMTVLMSCTSNHEVATLGTHEIEDVCRELCAKSATCGRPAPWCAESGCDDCVAECADELSAVAEPQDEFCQSLFDAMIECGRDSSCSYFIDGVGDQPPSCVRADRAALACIDANDELAATGSASASSGGSGGFGGGFGGSGGFGGGRVTSIASITTVSGSVSTTGPGGAASITVSTTGNAGPDIAFIPFDAGWAPISDNDYGVQGAFYTFSDEDTGGTSLISLIDFSDSGADSICINGVVGRIENGPDGTPAYGDHWGAALGFNLSQEAGNDAALAYDAQAHFVNGFAFTLRGANPLPAMGELRFSIKVAGDPNDYCRSVVAAGDNIFRLDELWQSCWESDANAPTPDPSRLEALHWTYVSNTTGSYDFDMCITALGVLIE